MCPGGGGVNEYAGHHRGVLGGRAFRPVAIARVPRHDQLADLVAGQMQRIPGIANTNTLIAFRSYSQHDLEAMWDIGFEEPTSEASRRRGDGEGMKSPLAGITVSPTAKNSLSGRTSRGTQRTYDDYANDRDLVSSSGGYGHGYHTPSVQAPAIATSMLGSLYGAIRTWDDTISLTDLFGYSGHAFILNIERTLCPSGPTAWDWGAILFPLRQMFTLRRLCATCDMRSVEEARELIWQRTVEGIDAGRPAVLWDVIYPEFYLAYGYDLERGEYLVHGPAAERVSGRVSWERLGLHTGKVWALFPGPHEGANRDAARTWRCAGRFPGIVGPSRGRDGPFGGDAWMCGSPRWWKKNWHTIPTRSRIIILSMPNAAGTPRSFSRSRGRSTRRPRWRISR